ncbi:MAG: flagellar basal body-associated FliL family protein [Clostridium sp.]|nr:flagellar basal body-associated FliL family protein [Clostridium sp.]
MEGKSGYFILIGIVAFLSLTLAILVIILFLQGGSVASGTGQDPKVIDSPSDNELIKLKMFEEKMPFNLKNGDAGKNPVIVISAEVSYFKKVRDIDDTTAKIEANKSKLQEIVGTYFQSLTLKEVMEIEAKEKARSELTKRMNESLLANEKARDDIVYTIIFDQWFYQ